MAIKNIIDYDKGPGNTRYITWDTLGNGDEGQPLECPGFSDKTLIGSGEFDGATTVGILGSNDGSVWVQLKDAFGDAITFTENACILIAHNPKFLKPTILEGTGSTAINISITAKGQDQNG